MVTHWYFSFIRFIIILAGIAVAVLVGIDDGDVVWLVSGIMAILGGVAMCVDALKTYGVF